MIKRKKCGIGSTSLWKRLHIVTVTIFKEHLLVTITTLTITVTISSKYLIVPVTMFKEHLIAGVNISHYSQIFHWGKVSVF